MAATNGSSKRKKIEPLLPEDFLEEDETSSAPFLSGYMGFEMVVATLINAANEANLNLFDASSTMDTTSLERHFGASCAPQEWRHPVDLWAEIGFYWPAEYTAISLYGDEALCSLYHSEGANCRHRPHSATLFTELEVEYTLPFNFVRRLDSDEGVERTARRIRQLFSDVVAHDNIVGVEARALFTGESLQLSSIKAGHVWALEDEFSDPVTLQAAFVEIFEEIRTVLLRFYQDFSTPQQETPHVVQ